MTRVRVTVMVLVMEVNMMDMQAAREIWCVGPTTASSLELTTMRRMTAVRSPRLTQHKPKRRHQERDLPSTQIYPHFFVHLVIKATTRPDGR